MLLLSDSNPTGYQRNCTQQWKGFFFSHSSLSPRIHSTALLPSGHPCSPPCIDYRCEAGSDREDCLEVPCSCLCLDAVVLFWLFFGLPLDIFFPKNAYICCYCQWQAGIRCFCLPNRNTKLWGKEKNPPS